MAINPSNMTNEIVALLPSEWQPGWVDSKPPKEWLLAQCSDVAIMWGTIILTPGLGPPSSPPFAHGHTVLSPIAPVTTNVSALNYPPPPSWGLATTFFTQVVAQVATHLQSSAIVAAVDTAIGGVLHDHALAAAGVPQDPFTGLAATASALKSSVISALNVAGIPGAPVPYPGGSNSLDTLYAAIASGMLQHMETNGQLTMAVGAGHVHVVS